ncbi:MAG: cell wall anchor protein [Verrucomicrobiota bacterium]|jgi:hypothetical protein
MKAIEGFSLTRGLGAVVLAALCLAARLASAATVNAVWNSATDVPVTTNGYTATGNTVNFTLNFAPATGTDLMVVSNTALGFIVGTFDNLAQGQAVALSYGGVTYRFVANYYGGSGSDLVLVWASNRAFAWGYNFYGELGDNSTTDRHAPVPVTSTGVLTGKTVVALAAGGNTDSGHSLALCSDGTVVAWGDNEHGDLGDNTTTQHLVPVAVNTAAGVSALHGKTVVAIAAGGYHSLALCSDGTVAAWGYDNYGQLGDNGTGYSTVPVAVDTASGSALFGKTVVAIGAGAHHSLALCSDGTLAAWGDNFDGQLGDNTTTQRNAPVAVNTNSGVSALYGKTVVAIAAGDDGLALCSDGTLAAWGRNDHGQLGDNGIGYSTVPVAVNTAPLAASQRFAGVFSGSMAYHSLALVAAPPASQIILSGAQTLANGSFQFAFTNTPGAFFGVVGATNPALPLSNCTPLGDATEVSPGQFQFSDPQTTNSAQRFYRVRSP